MFPRGRIKKFAKYVQKLLLGCLTTSSQKIISCDNNDNVCDALDISNPFSQSKAFAEPKITEHMNEYEARKIAAHAKAVATIVKDDLKLPYTSFDLVGIPSIELYPISKRNHFFDQMISKFTRYPLDKLIIMKSFSSADDTHFIGLSFHNSNAVMIVYANHPLIKVIANALLTVSKEVEYRWLNLREIEILNSY